MTTELVRCSACGIVGYPRKNGTPRKHTPPGASERVEKKTWCPGSGQTGTPVERTR